MELTLKGEIVYTSKDYHITLYDPFYARNTGKRLIFMIPARYTTPLDINREQRKDGVIRLEERAPQELITLYETYKDIPFENYAEHFLFPHRERLYTLLEQHLLTIDQHTLQKRKIKNRFKNSEISNKEQSQAIQRENLHIKKLNSLCARIKQDYLKKNDLSIPAIHHDSIEHLIKKWHKEKINKKDLC